MNVPFQRPSSAAVQNARRTSGATLIATESVRDAGFSV